ncbi:MAG: VCBS repeat-containing protein [Acetatifactor sp.]
MRKKWIAVLLSVCICNLSLLPVQADELTDTEMLILQYQDYQDSFEAIEKRADVESNGFIAIADQSFPVVLESFGEEEVTFLPIMDGKYHRLAVLILDGQGNVLFKTNQLETNNKYMGQLSQPTRDIAAVSFQDLDGDGLTDIVLITNCENSTGSYAGKTYKVGDVLFQGDRTFYRDWRISDKINRFSMNKSAEFIISYVRDGNSTEALYTASTLEELLENGFSVAEEQCYYRNFEKQGLLQVVPGSIHIANYDVFMIYLVNEQGYIVWSFQPMGDYDNLYALKGMTCRDMDGDGMKDLVVLARYSYAGPEDELLVDTKCSIYYQRTDGFEEDTEFSQYYQCTETDTVGGLVEIIREYWGWTKEE